MEFKIGGLSLSKLPQINQVAELAVKTNMPLNNLTVCTKLAESILFGILRKNSIHKNFVPADFKSPVRPNVKKTDEFSR